MKTVRVWVKMRIVRCREESLEDGEEEGSGPT